MADSLTFAEEAAPAPKKPALLKRLLPPLLFLLVGGGAGAAAMYFLPQLLPQLAPAPDAKPKPPKVQVAPLAYIELPNSFTANLKDSGRYVQVKIALTTHGGDPVSQSVERHKVAIIAATLDVLADTTQADLDAPGGRDRLTTRIRIAINDVLLRKTGAAGIDDVLLTSYVVQ
jgi:flagellar basal body-associated protein FliL